VRLQSYSTFACPIRTAVTEIRVGVDARRYMCGEVEIPHCFGLGLNSRQGPQPDINATAELLRSSPVRKLLIVVIFSINIVQSRHAVA
jgi:hypothetical protein